MEQSEIGKLNSLLEKKQIKIDELEKLLNSVITKDLDMEQKVCTTYLNVWYSIHNIYTYVDKYVRICICTYYIPLNVAYLQMYLPNKDINCHPQYPICNGLGKIIYVRM